ncbi:hypothetical protein N658DRAFT_499428 [Parathielavia hyrcaniae]|uniref:Uncharacterized protein n=1 Tax=Parathielavia hyrcaniae TaxID=113614 RepID=A0AAN6PZU2_9PEZI|nr:hypothetical protein N658DRAFT_499428 [Parathielavia hyrcaniae]
MCASHTQAVKEVALRLPGDLKENFAAEYADNELDPKRVQWMYTLLGASRPSSSASSSTGSSSKGGGGGGSTGSSASKHLQPPRPQGSQTQRHR